LQLGLEVVHVLVSVGERKAGARAALVDDEVRLGLRAQLGRREAVPLLVVGVMQVTGR
jgi:hypothetical protein